MSPPQVPVRVVGGEGAGHARRLDGERLEVHVDRAFAPGQPAALIVSLAEGELGVEGRTVGSRRLDDGAFFVTFRLVNLTRDARLALGAALAALAD